jgi:3-deoxy-7-phosphoheptulonate synthase
VILVLNKDISSQDKERLRDELRAQKLIIKEMKGVEETIFGVVGQIERDIRYFETLPGVFQVIPISKPYKLVSREMHPASSVINVGDVAVGGDRLVVIAGPCGVEGRQRTLEIARAVRASGAVLFRGGAFKPRTSPYSFQGMGEEGLKILAEVREETGMGIVTEMTATAQADLMMKYVDVVQIGARNMQSFELLKTVGRLNKPVLLKRGISATIEEWLMAAEYILSEGNDKVILCERGIRTFETYTRNTLDLTAIPVVKKLSHLPVIVDPSHATGIREKVSPMARAAIAAGADGIIVEVHTEPEKALSDGPQSLYPYQFEQLMRDLSVIAPVVGKQLDFGYIQKARVMARPVGKAGAPARVVYRGAPGSSGHRAAAQFFGADVSDPRSTFAEVFDAVADGQAAFGIIPLENSLTGSIHENYDHLMAHDLTIVGELTLRIVHSLIGRKGTALADIRRVYATPQVFERCAGLLEQHPQWDAVAVKDTTAGVIRVKESKGKHEAAVGSRESAALFDLALLKEGIETSPRNFTRFAVIAAEDPFEGPKEKSSIVFSVADRPGALFETLKVFADRTINMVKLESRPVPDKSTSYLFYVDMEIDINNPAYGDVLGELKKSTQYLKLLGTYRKGATM